MSLNVRSINQISVDTGVLLPRYGDFLHSLLFKLVTETAKYLNIDQSRGDSAPGDFKCFIIASFPAPAYRAGNDPANRREKSGKLGQY